MSTDSFKGLISHINKPCIIFDETGKVEYMNSQFTQRLDLQQMPVTYADIFTAPDFKTAYAAKTKSCRLTFRDQKQLTFDVIKSPLASRYLILVGKPLSQSELETKVAYLQNIIENIPGHLYWKDLNSTIIGSNLAQAKFFGFTSVDEIVGLSAEDIARDSESAKLIRSVDRQVIESKKPVTAYEFDMTLDGKVTTFLTNKTPLFDEDGEVIGLLGVSFNVTEAKAEADQKSAVLESVIAMLPGHVFWLDKNNVFLGCNRKQANSAGFDNTGELIGKSIYDIFSKEEADALSAINAQVMRSNKPYTVEEPGVYADGKPRVFLSQKAPLKDSMGKVIGVLGVAFDITEKKQAEQLKVENKIVEEKFNTSKLLAASIAHELRTPLATFRLYARQLELFNAENHTQDPEVVSIPAKMAHVVNVANTFIDMMLMNVEANKIALTTLKPIPLLTTLADVLKLYPMEADERNLVRFEIDKNADFTFMGDFELFKHVIFNLMKNALYYIRASGKPDCRIHVYTELGKQKNILHFVDNGTGLSDETRCRIFNSFYSETRHGTGVGLALCKVIMRQFKGDITCESKEGEFTHFTLSFPKPK